MCILSFAWRTEATVPFIIVKNVVRVAIVTPIGILVPEYFGMRNAAIAPRVTVVITRNVLRDRMLPMIFGIFDSSLDISLTAIVKSPMSAAIPKKAKNSYTMAYSPYPSTER